MIHPIIAEDLEHIYQAELDWKYFMNKTVLVSGASGFLPAYIVETLLYINDRAGLNIQVLGIVRNQAKAEQRFSRYMQRADLRLIIQDISDPIETSNNIDIIIHAASQASPKYYGVDPVGTLEANTIGTRNLLKLAHECKAEKLLFFSTSEVYGQVSVEQIPTPEDTYGYLDPTNVRSCYAESKRMGETMCIAWLHQYQVPSVIVRPFHIYGPGMSLDDGRVYADFMANMVRGEDIVLKSDGQATRSFCYLADATIGFFTVILRGELGQAYNIGNDMCEISISGLAERLVALMPDKELKVTRQHQAVSGYIPSIVSRSCPDITKVRAIGWNPTITIEEGFTRTLRSFM